MTPRAPEPSSHVSPRWSFEHLNIPDDDLHAIRQHLYHSARPGFFVFRDFLGPALADHLVRFWSTQGAGGHRPFPGKRAIRVGCPNFHSVDAAGNANFFNFLWNRPPDEATHAVAQQIQILRNRLEARPAFFELYPHDGRCVSYRVTLSREGDVLVPPHRDWLGEDFDPRRTQMTLFLSEPGIDYAGRGFTFRTNQGRPVAFGVDVPVSRGDLVVWRYNNEHSVVDVHARSDQLGFARMTLPAERVYPASRAGAALDLGRRLARRLRSLR